ncbi:putative ufm1-specific protease 2 [Lasius niger]|uniref:Probable Ufm1-specific protease 2 n=1 Tax=Lasius niger TaxID=67767 RepID=A0A0J7P5D7_LASNI|nr:putative ufm1-specific protease 2 [Lasius niger]
MALQLQILSNILQRLECMETTATGYLYGIMYNNTLVVLTFSINSHDNENESVIDYTALQFNLPADIYFCGILHIGEFKEINPDVFKIASGKVGIHFPLNNVYLFRTDDSLKDTMLKDFLSMSKEHEKSSTASSNINHNTGPVNIIHANVLLKISGEKDSEETIRYAPVLQHIKRSFDSLECNLHLNALSLVNLNATSAELHAILVESICRNIRLIEMQQQDPESEDIKLSAKLPEVMHFKPRGYGHFFTIIYPGDSTNDSTMEYRKALHKALALDLTKPYFRRGNAIKFDIQANEILVNPHQALLHKGVTGKLSIVDGLYSYHHYMQDNFDDNGWGCAYRSLQTIISWFRLQGYTEIPIPSHCKIQQCLVDIGDKPSTFIGSKQWIGSTEISFVLQTFLNIDVKILCASSGEEMSALIPQLVNHFDTQGTPIMIGGGVLAHTILGVSYDESSGEGKFLILDPHYTGIDHLPTIINKGWCGWKTKDFWKKDAFYNMCLPQRPITF